MSTKYHCLDAPQNSIMQYLISEALFAVAQESGMSQHNLSAEIIQNYCISNIYYHCPKINIGALYYE